MQAVILINSPWWNNRVLPAQLLVLICEELHVLLVSVLHEHLVRLFLVEGTTHPTVRGMHGEDA